MRIPLSSGVTEQGLHGVDTQGDKIDETTKEEHRNSYNNIVFSCLTYRVQVKE
jgi:hypothetical protein